DWPSDATVLFRMKFVFTGIDQHTIAIYVPLIVDWFIRLTTIVECNRIGPHILFPLANFLAIVLPVHAMPVKIIVDVVFEARPDGGARIGGGCVDDNCSGSRTSAVVDLVFAPALSFFICAFDVVTKRACVPNVDSSVEFLDVVFSHERR